MSVLVIVQSALQGHGWVTLEKWEWSSCAGWEQLLYMFCPFSRHWADGSWELKTALFSVIPAATSTGGSWLLSGCRFPLSLPALELLPALRAGSAKHRAQHHGKRRPPKPIWTGRLSLCVLTYIMVQLQSHCILFINSSCLNPSDFGPCEGFCINITLIYRNAAEWKEWKPLSWTFVMFWKENAMNRWLDYWQIYIQCLKDEGFLPGIEAGVLSPVWEDYVMFLMLPVHSQK